MSLYINSLLIVEDDKECIDNYLNILSNKIKNIIVATNGEEALHIFNLHTPKIAIIDVDIPIINGLQVAKYIKEKYTDTYIILITGHDDKNFLFDAINIGVDKFMLKPINPKMLLNILERQSTILKNSIHDLEKEINFYHFVENAKNLMLQIDSHGYIKYVNKMSKVYFLVNPDEAIGNHITTFLSQESRVKAERYLEKIKINPNINQQIESKFVNKDGKVFYVIVFINKILDNFGNLIYINLNVNDVTELKFNEIKVKKINHDISIEQQIAKICSFECILKDKSLKASKNFYNIFGLDEDKEITFDDFITNFVHQNYQDFLLRHREGILTRKVEFIKIDLVMKHS
ncbi:MAG: response regulator, partial [Campylobacterales bacterium]|nr:response regulator [Campylobacterales bacterium]